MQRTTLYPRLYLSNNQHTRMRIHTYTSLANIDRQPQTNINNRVGVYLLESNLFENVFQRLTSCQDHLD